MHDYMIVGAGSAGCVLAHRLSEDPQVSVLLLEAGPPDRSPLIRIPLATSLLYKGPYDWAFETEPQPQLNGLRLYFARGKGWGGSSTINSMIYMRGAPLDYDQWASLGNSGWSYAEVLPYFKKLEHYERGASDYHGVGGRSTWRTRATSIPSRAHLLRRQSPWATRATTISTGPRTRASGCISAPRRTDNGTARLMPT